MYRGRFKVINGMKILMLFVPDLQIGGGGGGWLETEQYHDLERIYNENTIDKMGEGGSLASFAKTMKVSY